MQCAPHELAACSFPAWYPAFEHLTFRSELLPLPPGFADFLIRDGVFVRSGTSAVREPAPCMPSKYAKPAIQNVGAQRSCLSGRPTDEQRAPWVLLRCLLLICGEHLSESNPLAFPCYGGTNVVDGTTSAAAKTAQSLSC